MPHPRTETQRALVEEIERIAGRALTGDENLLGLIDSLAWVELINVVDEFAQAKALAIDLESLLVGRELNLNQLLEKLGEEKLK